MKKFLALVLTLVLATTVWAANASYDGGFFKVEVPDNWQAQKQSEESIVLFAPDKSLVCSVTKLALDGATIKDVAEALNKKYNGKGVEEPDKNTCAFFAMLNGKHSAFFVINYDDKGKECLLVTETGAIDSDVASHFLESLERK